MQAFLGWAAMAVAFILCGVASAQTPEQVRWLQEFSTERAVLWEQQRTQAESLARAFGLPIRFEDAEGRIIEIQMIRDGLPMYYTTHNLNAARTISTNRVWPGGTGGFSLTGSTDTLGIWDGGGVRLTHQEFGGRATQIDGASPASHPTHVAGTMIAAGVDVNAKGMAYQARLRAYDWNSDLSEMAAAAAAGLRVSNHSYGYITGWRWTGLSWQWWGNTAISATTDYNFGFYSTISQDWDIVAWNAPYYLIVTSAGNDRLDGPSSQPVTHSHSGSGSFTCIHDLDGGPSGYDCISHNAVSKNVLTVGAVDDIPGGYTQPGDVVMSSFSSWGPTDDGRIKPDIVANGVALYSSNHTSNTAYITYSGTSMSSPNASGSLGLLLQHQKNLHGNNPLRASTLKGLVIHTADEAGTNPGPDYAFGWGLMNTLRAVQVMSANAAAGGNKHIRELVLNQGQTINIDVYSNGTEPLRATICWTDPAGTSPPPSLNPPNLMLVNDVDLRIIRGVTTYSPWILNPASPASPATTGDNFRDNVEQVHIASPTAGTHTVRVNHKGILQGGSQVVSLIITGASFDATIAVLSPNGSEVWETGSTRTIQWSSSGVSGNVKIELSRNGGSTFETLFASTPNDGSKNWIVSGPATAAGRVRISSVDNPSVFDMSDANFQIIDPSITVVVPNGGESWAVGSTQVIQWTSGDVSGNVIIELSRNGGSTFETLFGNTPNDGSESWTVTGPVTANARIRVASLSFPSAADTSNADFSIVQPFITVVSPNGGEVWGVGSTRSIEWTSQDVTGNVRIELSRNGGSSYEELFGSIANTGSQEWVVSVPVSTSALVRVSSVALPSIFDVSDAPFSIVPSFHFLAHLVLRDNGGSSDTLEFGVAAGATDGIDSLFGEVELPPRPPSGAFDVRWQISGTEGLRRDIRDTLGGTRTAAVYVGLLQPGSGGYPFALRWDASELPEGSFILRDRFGGMFFSVDMRMVDSLVIAHPAHVSFEIEYRLEVTVSVSVLSGWSMLSLPVTVVDRRRELVFPTAVSSAFTFAPGGYVVHDTLRYGRGYWLKFDADQEVNVTGVVRSSDSIAVSAGWNMIGSITYDVAVANITQVPPGIVQSAYFGAMAGGGYAASDTIRAMRSYWVKSSQAGKLILSGPVSRRSTQPSMGTTQ